MVYCNCNNYANTQSNQKRKGRGRRGNRRFPYKNEVLFLKYIDYTHYFNIQRDTQREIQEYIQ